MAADTIKIAKCPLCPYEHEYRLTIVRVPVVGLVGPDKSRPAGKQEVRVAATCPNQPPEKNSFSVTLAVEQAPNTFIAQVSLTLLTPPAAKGA